ncbi:hypothetical protein [Rhodococcus opacus]|nr:hypothetical protein [Rhodococcus opacus]MDV7085603.1 hypothetical protein [Rhodococcus opacus]
MGVQQLRVCAPKSRSEIYSRAYITDDHRVYTVFGDRAIYAL